MNDIQWIGKSLVGKFTNRGCLLNSKQKFAFSVSLGSNVMVSRNEGKKKSLHFLIQTLHAHFNNIYQPSSDIGTNLVSELETSL